MSYQNDVFYEDLLKGSLIKEIVSVLLQKSGYQVLPYGYEITLSGLSKELSFIPKTNSETVSRIRGSPDLLVFRPQKEIHENCYEMADLMLVEVKMRKTFPNSLNFMLYDETKLENLREYKRHWSDSFLLVVIPKGNVFYIQRIDKLAEKPTFNASLDFVKLQKIFTNIEERDFEYFKKKAKQIMESFNH